VTWKIYTPASSCFPLTKMLPIQINKCFIVCSPPTEADEYVLCCIQINASGVLCIRPDFNRGRRPYIIETTTLGRGMVILIMQLRNPVVQKKKKIVSRSSRCIKARLLDISNVPRQDTHTKKNLSWKDC
jgi:hypothetical protein